MQSASLPCRRRDAPSNAIKLSNVNQLFFSSQERFPLRQVRLDDTDSDNRDGVYNEGL